MAVLDDDDKKWLKDNFLTRSDADVNSIKGLIGTAIEEKIDEKGLVTKDDIKHLPTTDKFYEKMDEIVGELKTIREEQPIQAHTLSEHSDRIKKIEEKLQITTPN